MALQLGLGLFWVRRYKKLLVKKKKIKLTRCLCLLICHPKQMSAGSWFFLILTYFFFLIYFALRVICGRIGLVPEASRYVSNYQNSNYSGLLWWYWDSFMGWHKPKKRGQGLTMRNSFSWAGDGWEEAPWGEGLASKPWDFWAGSSFPQLCVLSGTLFWVQHQSPFWFEYLWYAHGYFCTWVLHSGRGWMEREREMGPCTDTPCLPPNPGFHQDSLVWETSCEAVYGTWAQEIGIFHPLLQFPMLGWLFHLKIEAYHSISQKIPIFLVLLGNSVVHWDGGSGSGSGIRALVVFFLLFLWPGTILSTLLHLFLTAKMGL